MAFIGTGPNITQLNADNISSGTLPVSRGGTGTASPSLVAGSGISISGTWPNQTVTAAGGGVTSLNGNTGALNGLQTIASGDFNASSFTITNLPTGYRFFKILMNCNTGSASGLFRYGYRFSTNNGGSYFSSNYVGVLSNQIPSGGAMVASVFENNDLAPLSQNYVGGINMWTQSEFTLHQPTNGQQVMFHSTNTASRASFSSVSTESLQSVLAGGAYNGTTYINAVQFLTVGGVTFTGSYVVLGAKI